MKVHRIERAGGSASPSADPISAEVVDLRAAVTQRDAAIARLYQRLEAAELDNDALQARIETIENRDAYHLSVAANAHTFNNLLTIVQCHLQLMEADTTAPSAEDLATLRRAMTHAQRIARRMVRWNDDDPIRRLSVNAAVKELVQLTRPLLVPEVSVHLILDDSDPEILAAERALLDALVNVVINAKDAMGRGAVRITTRAETASVLIEVTDDGPGMDGETIDQIFEAGFTTKGEDGHGVGLTSVTALFDRVSGDVHVQSAPNAGTTFTFRFPRARPVNPSA